MGWEFATEDTEENESAEMSIGRPIGIGIIFCPMGLGIGRGTVIHFTTEDTEISEDTESFWRNVHVICAIFAMAGAGCAKAESQCWRGPAGVLAPRFAFARADVFCANLWSWQVPGWAGVLVAG